MRQAWRRTIVRQRERDTGRREKERQETGDRQGDGRQAWRRETGRQRYRETGRGMGDRHVDVRQ